jgi:hypothetical protein
MPRIRAICLALAHLAVAAPVWAQPPFFLAYGVPAATPPSCHLGVEPSNFQNGNPNALPVLDPVGVPIGSSIDLDLCFLVWPPAPSTSGVPGVDGNGTDVCAVELAYASNGGGITITSIDAADPAPASEFPDFRTNLAGPFLGIAGGDPVSCQLGTGTLGSASYTGIHLGRVRLQGVGPGSSFELQNGKYADAANLRRSTPNTVIATSIDHCGDGIVDPGEECDNSTSDCLACQTTSGFTLSGRAGTAGSLSFSVDGVPLSVDFSTIPNEPAQEIILAAVAAVNAAPSLGAIAAQVDDPAQAGSNDGRRLITTGSLTSGPSLVDPTPDPTDPLTVPEPGQLLMLGIGIAFLLIVGRRRIRA